MCEQIGLLSSSIKIYGVSHEFYQSGDFVDTLRGRPCQKDALSLSYFLFLDPYICPLVPLMPEDVPCPPDICLSCASIIFFTI